MIRETPEKVTKKGQKNTTPSYRAAARALGCTMGHLWLVVHGQRESADLTLRYQALFGSPEDLLVTRAREAGNWHRDCSRSQTKAPDCDSSHRNIKTSDCDSNHRHSK